MNTLARLGRCPSVRTVRVAKAPSLCTSLFRNGGWGISAAREGILWQPLSGEKDTPFGVGAAGFTTAYGSNDVGKYEDRVDDKAISCEPLGTRLRDLLNELKDGNSFLHPNNNDGLAVLGHAGDALRHSLQELRMFRMRDTRDAEEDAEEQKMSLIRDCLVLLDHLSLSLPRAEDYSSSWLGGDVADGSLAFLNQELLNDFLKEWMIAWKQQQQQQQGRPNETVTMLPSPSRMADNVDKYRSRCLFQPDPTSYNLLLNAMIHAGDGNGNNNNNNSGGVHHRIKAIRLADDYLRRLLQAQKRSCSSYVDTVSVTTVMKGWVDLGQPQKAQEWLDVMGDTDNNNNTGIPSPNAIAYSTVIHGWAKRGEALRADSILERALEEAKTSGLTTLDGDVRLVDRVVFHTVMDAWAARAEASHRATPHKVKGPIPAVRAKALVHTMDELADSHPLTLGHLRPDDETWHKLIAVVAASSPSPQKASTADEEVGPRAAEKLLVEFETKHAGASSPTPVVLLNRILKAYCSRPADMEEAGAFYHRRCRLSEGDKSSNATAFPNEVTFNTILTGWANAANVASKRKKKNPSNQAFAAVAAEIPIRAEEWLKTLEEHENIGPSTRSYGSVLQAWSLSTGHHKDAANRAESLLRRSVWPLLEDSARSDSELAKGIVICTNIALRAWSNQTASSEAASKSGNQHHRPNKEHTVKRCLWLFHDFLALTESAEGQNLRPTEETFRAVLHAIATPSNGMNSIQKHDHAKALLACMQDRFRLQPSKGDVSKFERLKKRRDTHQGRG